MKLRNVIFYVTDIDRSKEFYKELSFKVEQDFGNFVSFSTSEDKLWFSIMEPDTSEKEPGKQVCCFWVNDIESLYANIKEKKLDIATELFSAPFGKTFAIYDPDSNKIEFVEE